jgi:SHAQKYF class myb-like DNA-binding protein
MEEYCPFNTLEEKNPHKFSIEIDHPQYPGSISGQDEIDKGINYLEEDKPSNDLIPNKTTLNTTIIFSISNLKENNPNENISSQKEKSNSQNMSEEKQKNYNSKENENSDSNNEYNSGRWTNEEHQKFIEGILNYGNEWKRVQSIIRTRSSTQARSHAQKFFLRMKKEISPKILSDQNQLVEYIINTSNISTKYTNLTQEQKDRLFSVIRSNLKSDESQNKLNNQYNNQYNKDGGKSLDYNIEEVDNLGYDRENLMNKNIKINDNDIGEKRKITFCSKKRKNSNDFMLNINDNKIFNIKKDMNHKKSLEILKSTDNLINNLPEKNAVEEKRMCNDINNYNYNQNIKNINNNINNDIFINKTGNLNNYPNFNNTNTNFIIQNNYYNIINNYNTNNNNINSINNFMPSYQNAYLSNDSINSDVNNHNNKIYSNDNFKIKDRNIKNIGNESLFSENNNINIRNVLDNYSFLNNENFFPNVNKNIHNEKNFDNIEQNDPFNLKFENVIAHNDNTIINDNISLNNNNLELGHETDDYEIDRENFGRNNNEKPYDD